MCPDQQALDVNYPRTVQDPPRQDTGGGACHHAGSVESPHFHCTELQKWTSIPLLDTTRVRDAMRTRPIGAATLREPYSALRCATGNGSPCPVKMGQLTLGRNQEMLSNKSCGDYAIFKGLPLFRLVLLG